MRRRRGASPRKSHSAGPKKSGHLKRATSRRKAPPKVPRKGSHAYEALEFKRKYGVTPKFKRGEIYLTPAQRQKVFEQQKRDESTQRRKRVAVEARKAYKVRKKDWGKIVLIGTKGQRDPQAKGRKAYAIYVTKSGQKRLLNPGGREPFRARKRQEIQLPYRRNLKRKIEEFQAARLRLLGRGRVRRAGPDEARAVRRAVAKAGLAGDAASRLEDFRLSGRGRGAASVKLGGQWDFNNRAVSKLASHIRKVIRSQRGQRAFLIRVMGLIELPDGTREVMEFAVDIARRDADAIRLAGIENFVRQKFYAFMARELAFLGFVSSGSANHIRRLAENRGKPRDEWVNRNGQSWVGRDLEVARIISLEWRIEQL